MDPQPGSMKRKTRGSPGQNGLCYLKKHSKQVQYLGGGEVAN